MLTPTTTTVPWCRRTRGPAKGQTVQMASRVWGMWERSSVCGRGSVRGEGNGAGCVSVHASDGVGPLPVVAVAGVAERFDVWGAPVSETGFSVPSVFLLLRLFLLRAAGIARPLRVGVGIAPRAEPRPTRGWGFRWG